MRILVPRGAKAGRGFARMVRMFALAMAPTSRLCGRGAGPMGLGAEVKFMKFTTWRVFCELPSRGRFQVRLVRSINVS